ncbi:MAG: hypothetical protein K6A71_01690, partial [Lachnospiraceae bacterium]|nr:hypothetical protein [Lachnospiraceae bacterium]
MSEGLYEQSIVIEPAYARSVFGELDSFVKKIERSFHVTVVERNGSIKVMGSREDVECASDVLVELVSIAKKGSDINEQTVNYCISMAMENKKGVASSLDDKLICHTING